MILPYKSVFAGTGSYLPDKIMTNRELEQIVDTNDEWILQRTGIEQRHIAAEGQTTSDMAIRAGAKALDAAGLTGGDIDCVIVATTTPDKTFPSVAVHVQAGLGIRPCPAFDVQAVCSGFVYALSVADSFIKCGQVHRCLVIGAERMSSILDWEDRTTCVLFGDGAGAAVLESAVPDGGQGGLQRGILSSHMYAEGSLSHILHTSGGTATTGDSGLIRMEGREVFKYAVNYMSEIVTEVLEANDITPDRIDWLVPHQANIRIIEATARKLEMAMDRVVVTVDKHGNTSAASIPLALDCAVRDGRIQKGDLLLFEALGGGLTWGATLARF